MIHDADIHRLAERAARFATRNVEVVDSQQQFNVVPGAVELHYHEKPTVIVNQSDNILLWYLPTALSSPNQHLMWTTIRSVEQVLLSSINTAERPWRTHTNFFRCINISPAWFQQGCHICSTAHLSVGGQSTPEPSALLKPREQVAILSGALAIMHSDMYRTGREALVRLGRWAESADNPEVSKVLSFPLHVDHFGRPQWMDLLVTFGDYSDLHFLVPSIHSRFLYTLGTLIALSGQLLLHGTGHANGDRGIILYYMRDNFHEFVNVTRCNYMEYSKVPTQM
ncbi:hypothetical protein V8E55_005303 [Tylopilus felleus]